jgi:hypothetical protein
MDDTVTEGDPTATAEPESRDGRRRSREGLLGPLRRPLNRSQKIGLAVGVVLVLAMPLVSRSFTYLNDRGYLTRGLPGALPQATGQPAPAGFIGSDSPSVPINSRADDDRPLRLGEVFRSDQQQLSSSSGLVSFRLRGARLDSNCAGAVWGPQLQGDLRAGGCSQIVRGFYRDDGNGLIGVVAILNMRDVAGSRRIVDDLGPEARTGFVLPLTDRSGVEVGRGYSDANAETRGHFVFLAWAQRADGAGGDYLSRAIQRQVRDASSELSSANYALFMREIRARDGE